MGLLKGDLWYFRRENGALKNDLDNLKKEIVFSLSS
jgi:hypothetical protein